MNLSRKSLLIGAAMVAASLSLTGCYDAVWMRTGTDDATRDADQARCRRQSDDLFPPRMNRYMSREGYYEKGEITCTDKGNGTQVCKEHGGQYHEPEFSEQDENSYARASNFVDCMTDQGYNMYRVKHQ
ncbi:MAG: hypothetical protein GAK28_02804 [Luteibacter sp.]|nr:MAG: hypothetical protein GAK28_02804 [Luteibacter sp.]